MLKFYTISQLLVLCSVMMTSLETRAQNYNQRSTFIKANSQWIFGINAGLNRNNYIAFTSAVQTSEGCASVADTSNGQLLFYSDGISCWNAAHQAMPNGDSLRGGKNRSTAQGVCIVPMIDSPQKYYLFTQEFEGFEGGYDSSRGRLHYSIVDMQLNGGTGDVVSGRKNILLDSLLGEAMIAVPGNNCDVWLIVHPTDTALFKTYHITKTGITPQPVVSTTGNQINGTVVLQNIVGGAIPDIHSGSYALGNLAVSPDRSFISITSMTAAESFWQVTGAGTLVRTGRTQGSIVCHFDPATGIVSDGLLVDTISSYGLSFSPNNTKLYVSTVGQPGFPSIVKQFGLNTYSSAAIQSSQQLVFSGINTITGQMKLYRDTIYLAGNGSFLHRINQPDQVGAAANFQLSALPLGLASSGLQLPNEVVYSMPPDTIYRLQLDTSVCVLLDSMKLLAPAGYTHYIWDNGSTAQTRTITQRGSYTVFCQDPCHNAVDTFIVKGSDVTFDLGPDTILCNGENYLLRAAVNNPSMIDFVWQDGSKANTLLVNQSGMYYATVQSLDKACTASDTVLVTYVDLRQDLGKDTAFCTGTPIHLQLLANAPQGSKILWNNGANTADFFVIDTGRYSVVVNNGPCAGHGNIRVGYQMCSCSFGMPTAFSPNGDGLNDSFLPVVVTDCPIGKYRLSIYNRWGQRIFASNQPSVGWDGTFNGTRSEVGTYFYELTFEGGTQRHAYYQKGDLTLIQ